MLDAKAELREQNEGLDVRVETLLGLIYLGNNTRSLREAERESVKLKHVVSPGKSQPQMIVQVKKNQVKISIFRIDRGCPMSWQDCVLNGCGILAATPTSWRGRWGVAATSSSSITSMQVGKRDDSASEMTKDERLGQNGCATEGTDEKSLSL